MLTFRYSIAPHLLAGRFNLVLRTSLCATLLSFSACSAEQAQSDDVSIAALKHSSGFGYDWSSGQPDPRSVRPETLEPGRLPYEHISPANSEPAKELWCVPGCRLEVGTDGAPVVPGWCTAWSVLGESRFVRESATDLLDDSNSVSVFLPNSAASKQTEYSCTRIDLNRVLRASLTAADGAITSFRMPGSSYDPHSFGGQSLGMNCLPGCVTDWEEFGLKKNDYMKPQKALEPLPDWCAGGSAGCGFLTGGSLASCPAGKLAPSVCVRIKFHDVNYGARDVE